MMSFYYSCPRRVLGGLSAQILLQEGSGVQRAGICCASLRHSGKLSSGICRYKKPRAKLMRGVESEFGYLG